MKGEILDLRAIPCKVKRPHEGEFVTLADAITELKLRDALPWNESLNVAPCTSW